MRILFFFKNSENLGIEYLSAVLKQGGHQTDLYFEADADNFGFKLPIFEHKINFKKIRRKIAEFKPDIFAFSVYTNTFPWVREVAAFLKENYNLPIVMGGPHATATPERLINEKFVDYILIGESEYSFLELANKLEKSESLEDIPNLWYKLPKDNDPSEFEIKKNPLRPLILNLDELPFPDKDLFYKYRAFNIRYYIITARGCPYNCSYCINHQYHRLYTNQKRLRRRSPENVINELLWAKKRYNFKSIYFFDDDFLVNKKWLLSFAKLYIEKIGLPFKCLVHPRSVSEFKVKLLKLMNCKDIDIGIESGSERIRLNILNRNIKNSEIIRSAKIIKKYRINLTTLNIINIPGEEIRDMIKTVQINYAIRPSAVHITSLYPYPNTEIVKHCLKYGIVDDKILDDAYNGISNYRSSAITNHPYKELGERIRINTPVFIHLPKMFKSFIFYLPPTKLAQYLYIFFSSSLRNSLIKLREQFELLLTTNK